MAFASTYSASITRGWRQPGRRRPRYSSSHWLWTAASCLLSGTTPTTGTSSNASGSLLASAFAPRRSAIVPSNRRERGLSGSGRGGGLNSSRSDAVASFTTHPSLSELLDEFDYDALILDQFGVLHNGKHPLAGTVDCVERIADGDGSQRKKLRLIVLSNTSSPSRTTLDRLHDDLGFDRSHFCGAVTSGEEAGRHIREVYGSDPNGKRKFVWCTWDATNENVPDPTAFLELCGPHVEPTVDVAAADFVVAHGSGAIRGYRNGGDGDDRELEIVSMGSFLDDGNLGEGTPIRSLLEECADGRLPLICANPDLVVQYHDGSLKHMPGKIARAYEEILEERLGGHGSGEDLPSVTIYGKPHAEHFEACLRKLEEEEDRSSGDAATTSRRSPLRVAHVGDSLHHDIAGANAAGVPSIFIVGGIHAEELLSPEESDSNMPSREKLRDFFDREGITPTHVLPVFNY